MAKVQYTINGKYNGKAMTQAQKGLSGLAKTASTAIKAVAGLAIVKELTNIFRGSNEVFLKQNEALKKFEMSTANAGQSLEKLNAIKKKVSQSNFFDDDSINSAMVMAQSMGLTEEQIENVMTAATDLAASGVMPLDQATKALSLTYSGTTSTLGKMIPQTKELTKEQLKNGEAVNLVKKQYADFASQMSNTFSGRDTQFKNAISDLKAAFGGITTPLKFISQGTFLGPINKMTDALVEHRNDILKWIVNFPQISKIAIDNVWQMVKYTFTGAGLKNLMLAWGNAILNEVVWLGKSIYEIGKMLLKDIGALIDFSLGNLFRKFNNMFADIGNAALGKLNESIAKIADNEVVAWLMDKFGFKGNPKQVITFQFKKDNLVTWEETVDKMSKNLDATKKNLMSDFKKMLAKAKDINEEFTDDYKDQQKQMISELNDFIKKMELPPDLEKALSAMVGTTENGGTEGNGGTGSTSGTTNWVEIASRFGEVGQMVSTLLDGNGKWETVVLSLLEKFVSAVEGVSQTVNVLFNIVSELFTSVAKAILPVVEEVATIFTGLFAPVKDILVSLLQSTSAIFKALEGVFQFAVNIVSSLAPVITLIGEMLGAICDVLVPLMEMLNPIWDLLLNILKPFLVIATVIIKSISNVFIAIYNGIIDIHNAFDKWFNYSRNQKARKDYITDYGDAAQKIMYGYDNSEIAALIASASTSSTSSAVGASASYTAARDIYLTVSFDHSFVGGDGREVALLIRDELQNAERLGY